MLFKRCFYIMERAPVIIKGYARGTKVVLSKNVTTRACEDTFVL